MVRINEEQVKRVAEFLKANPPKTTPLNFYSVVGKSGEVIVLDKMYPPLGHPNAVDYFFFACLHQYGFWYDDSHGYNRPMVGVLGGKELKGSDLLWTLFRRAFESNPEFFTPQFLSRISPRELTEIFFKDDVGTQWPDFDQRFALTRGYGQGLHMGTSPVEYVDWANNNQQPIKQFINVVSGLTGYNGDRFNKKATLLAMALANRPEQFLKVKDSGEWNPIVDYHLMRVALRLGLVDLEAVAGTVKKISGRRWVASIEEEAIREEVFRAMQKVIAQSGLSMSAIDVTFWLARKYCPEMSEPDCEKCMFNSVCEHRVGLFQPVFRTTSY
ncbi:hypothetical protein HYT45_01550 [Candidatus Uhrbacteria bacterium]|nr:hypothetical protein [Candidatus Uhrbacteria bacterium]